MKLRFLIIFLFTIFINLFACGQTSINDTLFLKNGNIITGEIKEFAKNEFIKIYTSDGLFFFSTNDILKISTLKKLETLPKPKAESTTINPYDKTNKNSSENNYFRFYGSNQLQEKTDESSEQETKYTSENNDMLNSLPKFLLQLNAGVDLIGFNLQGNFNLIEQRHNFSLGLGTILRYDNINLSLNFRKYKIHRNSNISVFGLVGGVFVSEYWDLSRIAIDISPLYYYGIHLGNNAYFTIGTKLDIIPYKIDSYYINIYFLPGLYLGFLI